MAEVTNVSGHEGNFKINIFQNARHVDVNKCIACGICSEKCPKKVDDSYNENMLKRKAIYIKYAQAVPLKYVIDKDNCIYFKNGKCKACEKFCPAGAIVLEETSKELLINVGSIILAPGFAPFDPSNIDTYGYSKNPNVVTSMEMERILSASGPTKGHLVKMSDHETEPKKIAWLQCVGSRDTNRCSNSYCSSVCCMYAIKESIVAKEHVDYNLQCTIFFMDLRTYGKDFEYYYNDAKNKGVKFVRTKVHTVDSIPNSDELSLRYVSENGKLISEKFDMVVLSVGLQIEKNVIDLSNQLNIELTKGNFSKTTTFKPVNTSKKGIYTCGTFQGPKDIPQSVIDASAAASSVGEIISKARHTKTILKENSSEINVIGERPRIGVFICMCGTNIAGVVDVNNVKNYSSKLPYVEYVSTNLYACSKDTQDIMNETIKKNKLNRVVVAACTPKTHEALFQETLVATGLNKYLFEMCNIRNHVSWVHKNNPKLATRKAKDLVKMAISKSALMFPLEETELDIKQTVLILGGGIAGISAGISLASQGYEAHIVDKSSKLGGNALNIYKTKPDEKIKEKLSNLIEKVEKDEKITVHLNTELSKVNGFVGNFESILRSNKDNQSFSLDHGIAIIATGGTQSKPSEYLYGKDPRILTSLDLDKKMMIKDPALENIKSAVFIQCVGSRDPDYQSYCSRLCCSHSITNALELKQINPEINIYILYRDIRTYGEKEYLYTKARKRGIIFIRYNLKKKPNISISEKKITVSTYDYIIDKKLEINADIITLASSIIPNKVKSIAQSFKIPLNKDGFFLEKHAKLGPSDFATDGVYLCGLSHYPKPIDESIAQGLASASRAIVLLSKGKIFTSGTVAYVETLKCSSCNSCVSLCPYSAPSLINSSAKTNPSKAEINPVLCKGCGICVASCRSGAIRLKGFDNNQIFAQISSLN